MNNIINIFRRDTTNIGDRYSTPFLYFGKDYQPIKTYDIWKDEFASLKEELHESIVVIGGGGLVGNEDFADNLNAIISAKPKRLIYWGTGINEHDANSATFPNYLTLANLVGLRDAGNPYIWVPCPSCIYEGFDQGFKIKHKIVVYEHEGYNLKVDAYPKMSNESDNIDAVLEFLGSGEYILTNTYHGVYWGTLLNRKVIITEVFSNKFLGLKYKAPIVELKNWEEHMENATNYPNALNECRKANVEFNERFKMLLSDLS